DYHEIYRIATAQAEKMAPAVRCSSEVDQTDLAQKTALSDLPEWVLPDASCLWMSKAQGRTRDCLSMPVTIRRINLLERQVVVVFEADGSQKVVPFSDFKDHDTCPLRPAEDVRPGADFGARWSEDITPCVSVQDRKDVPPTQRVEDPG
ncbi:unnamed protein product, partial [Prorocentrum cordatum]